NHAAPTDQTNGWTSCSTSDHWGLRSLLSHRFLFYILRKGVFFASVIRPQADTDKDLGQHQDKNDTGDGFAGNDQIESHPCTNQCKEWAGYQADESQHHLAL